MKNPFKKPDNDDDDIPFWIDESIITDYKKIMKMSKEQLKITQEQIDISKKIKASRNNPSPEQSDIDELRIRLWEIDQRRELDDINATRMHIQSLKAIVATTKIMRFVFEKIPKQRYDEILSKIDELEKQALTDEEKEILRWIRDYMKRAGGGI